MEQPPVVAEHHEVRRLHAHLRHIVDLQAAALVRGRLDAGLGIRQNGIQHTGGDPEGSLIGHIVDHVEQLVHPLTGLGGDKQDGGVGHVGQIPADLPSGICLSFVGNASGENAQGLFAFGYSLAQLVTAIQAGFSTYWGPYVYSHYRDEQERICRVHDVLNLLIFGFFCVLVMFEDIVFVIFPDKRGCLAIFPLLMLAVVFNILCEGTVYGNSIARKPWHDTIGIGLGALSNFGLCALLVPAFGLTGAALALAASNGLAFLYRSITGQMYYRTVASYPKTISGFLLAFAVTAIGTLLWQHFFIKFALVGVILFIYCTLYRAQLARLWSMGLGILRGIFHRK